MILKITILIFIILSILFLIRVAYVSNKHRGKEEAIWRRYTERNKTTIRNNNSNQLKAIKKTKDDIKGLCKWLHETKGITQIGIFELAEYLPEYEQHLKEQKNSYERKNY
ncbi:MAG TPA: hypothetical protein VJ962_12705 [Clostridia bacterium]|nr:hypothetical protein [Clostridia bacterium]